MPKNKRKLIILLVALLSATLRGELSEFAPIEVCETGGELDVSTAKVLLGAALSMVKGLSFLVETEKLLDNFGACL